MTTLDDSEFADLALTIRIKKKPKPTGKLDDSEFKGFSDAIKIIERHLAPIHPGTGTDQSVHARGGLKGSEAKRAMNSWVRGHWPTAESVSEANFRKQGDQFSQASLWIGRDGTIYNPDGIHQLEAHNALVESGVWSDEKIRRNERFMRNDAADEMMELGFVRLAASRQNQFMSFEFFRRLSSDQLHVLQAESLFASKKGWGITGEEISNRPDGAYYSNKDDVFDFLQLRHFAEIHPGTGTDQSVHAGGGGGKAGKKGITSEDHIQPDEEGRVPRGETRWLVNSDGETVATTDKGSPIEINPYPNTSINLVPFIGEDVVDIHTHPGPEDAWPSDGDWSMFGWSHTNKIRVVTASHEVVTIEWTGDQRKHATPREFKETWRGFEDELFNERWDEVKDQSVGDWIKDINLQMADAFPVDLSVGRVSDFKDESWAQEILDGKVSFTQPPIEERHFAEIHPGTGTDQSVHAGGAGGTQGLRSASGVDLSTWSAEDDNAFIGGDQADRDWVTAQARKFAERTGVLPTGITFVMNDAEAYVDLVYGGDPAIDEKMDSLEALSKARGAYVGTKSGAATEAIYYDTDGISEQSFVTQDVPIFGPHEGDPLYGSEGAKTAVHEMSHWVDEQTGGTGEHEQQFRDEIPEDVLDNLQRVPNTIIASEYRADMLAAYITAFDPTQPVYGARHFHTSLSPESIGHLDIFRERISAGLEERSFVTRSLAGSVFILIDQGEAVLVDKEQLTDDDRERFDETVERHLAPIHPGTGTDQSVHAGGGPKVAVIDDAGDVAVIDAPGGHLLDWQGRRDLRNDNKELIDFWRTHMELDEERFDPNVIGESFTTRVWITPTGRIHDVADHDPAATHQWRLAQNEGLLPDNLDESMEKMEELVGHPGGSPKNAMLVMGFSRGTIQQNVASFEVVTPVSRATKRAISGIMDRVEIEAIRPEFSIDVNTVLDGIGDISDDVDEIDSIFGDRAVKAFLTRHFKEIHPGTGTDQSVHGGGGGGGGGVDRREVARRMEYKAVKNFEVAQMSDRQLQFQAASNVLNPPGLLGEDEAQAYTAHVISEVIEETETMTDIIEAYAQGEGKEFFDERDLGVWVQGQRELMEEFNETGEQELMYLMMDQNSSMRRELIDKGVINSLTSGDHRYDSGFLDAAHSVEGIESQMQKDYQMSRMLNWDRSGGQLENSVTRLEESRDVAAWRADVMTVGARAQERMADNATQLTTDRNDFADITNESRANTRELLDRLSGEERKAAGDALWETRQEVTLELEAAESERVNLRKKIEAAVESGDEELNKNLSVDFNEVGEQIDSLRAERLVAGKALEEHYLDAEEISLQLAHEADVSRAAFMEIYGKGDEQGGEGRYMALDPAAFPETGDEFLDFEEGDRENVQETLASAESWLTQMVHPDVTEAVLPAKVIQDDDARADYSAGEISVSATDDTETFLHEYGHHLEHEPGNHEAVIAFAIDRMGDETIRPLSDIQAERGLEGTYNVWEVGVRDKWTDTYTGKLYKSESGNTIRSTEILSQGLQKLYSNPARFFDEDPEYFDFMVSLTRGDFVGIMDE